MQETRARKTKRQSAIIYKTQTTTDTPLFEWTFLAVTSNHVNEYDFTGLLRGVLWLVQIYHVMKANQWKRTTRLDVRD